MEKPYDETVLFGKIFSHESIDQIDEKSEFF